MSRDCPGILGRNPFAEIEFGPDNKPLSVHLLICSLCHEAFDGSSGDLADKCNHQLERTLVWKYEPDKNILGKRFKDTTKNEEGVILIEINATEFLVQIRAIAKHDTLTWDQYISLSALRVVSLSKIKKWQIFND